MTVVEDFDERKDKMMTDFSFPQGLPGSPGSSGPPGKEGPAVSKPEFYAQAEFIINKLPNFYFRVQTFPCVSFCTVYVLK